MIVIASSIEQAREFKGYLEKMSVQFFMWAHGNWIVDGERVLSLGALPVVEIHNQKDSIYTVIDEVPSWAIPRQGGKIEIIFRASRGAE